MRLNAWKLIDYFICFNVSVVTALILVTLGLVGWKSSTDKSKEINTSAVSGATEYFPSYFPIKGGDRRSKGWEGEVERVGDGRLVYWSFVMV